MLGWLYRMIVGRFSTCEHKWVVLKEVALYEDSLSAAPCGVRYELQCSKCGDLKSQEFNSYRQ